MAKFILKSAVLFHIKLPPRKANFNYLHVYPRRGLAPEVQFFGHVLFFHVKIVVSG